MEHANDPALKSWVTVPPGSDFSIQNLPFGVFRRRSGGAPAVGVAIGEMVLDLAAIHRAGLLSGTAVAGENVFAGETLNQFMACGRSAWISVRDRVSELLREDNAELRDMLNPILFPIHLGKTEFPLDIHEESGLRPGLSYARSTFRGKFHDHVLKIDAPAKTLQIDEDPVVTFTGVEEDFELTTQTGDSFFLDVTQVNPEFQGEIQIGVHGHLRQVFATEYIAQ